METGHESLVDTKPSLPQMLVSFNHNILWKIHLNWESSSDIPEMQTPGFKFWFQHLNKLISFLEFFFPICVNVVVNLNRNWNCFPNNIIPSLFIKWTPVMLGWEIHPARNYNSHLGWPHDLFLANNKIGHSLFWFSYCLLMFPH